MVSLYNIPNKSAAEVPRRSEMKERDMRRKTK